MQACRGAGESAGSHVDPGTCPHRCPGRYFAEAEVALVVGMILLSTPALALHGQQRVWEGGMGDPQGLLPAPDFRRLVGIKVPTAPCWVTAK